MPQNPIQNIRNVALCIIGLIQVTFGIILYAPRWWNNMINSNKRLVAVTVSCIFAVSYILYGVRSGRVTDEEQSISLWLKENQNQNLIAIFELTGHEKTELADIEDDYINSLDTIPDTVKDKLKTDVIFAREKKRMNLWLALAFPDSTIKSLNKMGINSLAALGNLTEEDIQKVVGDDIIIYTKLLKATRDVKTVDVNLKVLEYGSLRGFDFWIRVLLIFVTIAIGGTIISCIMVADCIGRAINRIPVPTGGEWGRHQVRPQLPTIPQQTNNNKGWLWNWFVGSHVSAQNCGVVWGWQEPQIVGNTMSFVVQLHQKNGKPYKIIDSRIVHVEILHKGEKMSCTKQLDKDNSNGVSISFTVHKSGTYKIHVMVNGKHIKGSPFIKAFEADSIDASKTGFTNYCSTIVCTVGQSYPLVIETKDCYDNPAMFKSDHKNYFKIKVTETESNARYIPTTQIIHNADSKQLTMHIKMEVEGCYQAAVSYGDIKLKNGDFNILVISDEDLEVVNRTTTKKRHNIWYEARLLTDNADSTEKAKRVYVYISPKQLTIKEYFFKIIGKKLHTWRVCPSTKFSFTGYNNRYDAPVMKIFGCSQLPVMLATKDRNVIAATFTNFLLRNIGL